MDGRNPPAGGRLPWWSPPRAPLTALQLWIRVLAVLVLGGTAGRAVEWFYHTYLEVPW